MMLPRSSGIQLPIFSLPSRLGIGDLGPAAYAFADFLEQTGQRVWQILPLTPTSEAHGHSPYFCPSSLALNPLLISPEMMRDEGWINQKDIDEVPGFKEGRVVYQQVLRHKNRLFTSAFTAFQNRRPVTDFEEFCTDQADWLEDYALFAALKTRHAEGDWNTWPDDIRLRSENAINFYRKELAGDMDRVRFLQFIAHNQWLRLKRYCNERSIHIFGDMPIYVPYDSVDVWSRPHLFKLDPEHNPTVVSGVPPDYFSKTGQRWGHPVYRWETHQEEDFSWWTERMARNLFLYDLVRIDHFRGLVGCWEIPVQEKTAVNGAWVNVPATDFFNHMQRRFINFPIIAEDLGLITPDVREAIRTYGFPGMRVLVFGFSGELSENPNAFHHIGENTVAYTGTHDTNTAVGWFETEITGEDKNQLFAYLGREVGAKDISWELIRLALMSRARLSILPMQDLLGLGAEDRINHPSKQKGNWRWRLSPAALASFDRERLKAAIRVYGRC
jgi:4-alpha-glucanotransferase